jgi:lysophospholipase L1-like esterase
MQLFHRRSEALKGESGTMFVRGDAPDSCIEGSGVAGTNIHGRFSQFCSCAVGSFRGGDEHRGNGSAGFRQIGGLRRQLVGCRQCWTVLEWPGGVEQLATRLGLAMRPSQKGGLNFAVGGARLDPRSGAQNLRAQADMFLKMAPRMGRTLYVVYGGGNDLLGAIGQPSAPAIVDQAVTSLRSIVDDLAKQGATDILVPNLPNVGITPEMRAWETRTMAQARELAERFNDALGRALTSFIDSANLRLHRLDVWAMAERAQADPAAFGFVDITPPCERRPTCEGYLFWDHVNPTTHAHARLAEAAYNLLPP